MGAVVATLAEAFPALPESHVRARVQEIYASFADARIRTYLPILVARKARSALQRAVDSSDPGTTHGGLSEAVAG